MDERESAEAREGGVSAFWTDDEDKVLRAMWAGVRVAEIADKLDRSRNSVIGRANRLGLPRTSREAISQRIQIGHAASPISKRQGRNGGRIDPWRAA